MSFDQLSSLESGDNRQPTPPNNPSYTDDPEFQTQSQSLLTALIKLNTNNQQLTKEVAHLGTRRDTPRVRERVHSLLEESRSSFKSVGENLKHLQTWEDLTPPQKFKLQKLSKTFATYLSSFQTLQRQALEKEKASVSAARSALDSGSTPEGSSDPFLQEQQQELTLTRLAPQDEVDFQDALIVEREEEIRNIEQGVGDLNVLFQQVAQIVTEQGEVLDTIANNVENVRDDTRGADRELRSAARYQKNARSKACCLLLILAVIFTIVLLAVFLG